MLHATVVDLNPFVDYEFRVVAINNVGVGEPSAPSRPIRTKAAGNIEFGTLFSNLVNTSFTLPECHLHP